MRSRTNNAPVTFFLVRITPFNTRIVYSNRSEITSVRRFETHSKPWYATLVFIVRRALFYQHSILENVFPPETKTELEYKVIAGRRFSWLLSIFSTDLDKRGRPFYSPGNTRVSKEQQPDSTRCEYRISPS